MISVLGMIESYLLTNGYDGLFNEDGECACEVGDLAPGDCLNAKCCAGIRAPCPDECGEHYWHMIPPK